MSTSLDSDDEWLYELNTRMSDENVGEMFSLDNHGQLRLEREAVCGELPVSLYVSSWSSRDRCHGLAYLLQPLSLASSGCPGSEVNMASGDYYGLSCSHNRTSWCQREYKEDITWPRGMATTCSVTRTGVDKSRCYMAGKLEVYFTVECVMADGVVTKSEMTYHLLQDDRPSRRSSHSRVRRALAANPPFFKRPHYNVNVREEGGKEHTVTTIQATDPQGKELTYSMVALVDSRSQDMFSMDPVSGTITTTTKLDREFMDVHYLRIVATTNDSPQLTATTTVQVIICLSSRWLHSCNRFNQVYFHLCSRYHYFLFSLFEFRIYLRQRKCLEASPARYP